MREVSGKKEELLPAYAGSQVSFFSWLPGIELPPGLFLAEFLSEQRHEADYEADGENGAGAVHFGNRCRLTAAATRVANISLSEHLLDRDEVKRNRRGGSFG